ncbi:MAG: hypothetical protein WCI71_03085 [Bacteroidota bacterium]
MKQTLIFIFLLFVKLSVSQNVMIMRNVFARPGDTVTVSLDISNTAKFVSFQYDLPLPLNVSYLGNSLQLTERSVNHVAIGNMVGDRSLRIFSYSPNNAAFMGESGTVVSFSMVIGQIRGEFPLTLENGIIGDSLSTNILTGVENGILSVFPLGLNDPGDNTGEPFGLSVFPNPFIGHAKVSFAVSDFSAVTLILYNPEGKKISSSEVGNFSKGRHTVDLPNEIVRDTRHQTLYYLEISARIKTGIPRNETIKILRIEK